MAAFARMNRVKAKNLIPCKGVDRMAKVEASLAPVLDAEKTMSYPKFTFSWASDLIAIFAFMTGSGAIAAGLNMVQAMIALTIAMLINVVLLSANGLPGFHFGIPMIVQMRPCFGDKAASYVSAIRAIPAILWTGYNSFLGALGLNMFSVILFGYDNIWVWFFVFHFAQVVLSMLGVKSILNFTAYAAIALFVVILIMGVYVFYLFGVENISSVASSGGSWGLPFWGVVTANVSMGITVVVNSSDYIRHVDNSSVPKYVASYACGLIPTVLVLSGLGMVVYAMSGIWSPVDLFVKYVPNFFIVIIAMAFIILGQFSTNMFANIMPANMIWEHIFKFPWWFTSVFTGCLSLFVLPWFLTTSNGFYSFMNVYGALLGPLSGIMITDFIFLRKQKYNMRALYEPGGQYSYGKGVNQAGIFALVAGFLLSIIRLDFSTIVGIVSSAVIYYVLYRFWVLPKFPQAEMAAGYVMESPAVIREEAEEPQAAE